LAFWASDDALAFKPDNLHSFSVFTGAGHGTPVRRLYFIWCGSLVFSSFINFLF